MPDAPDENLSIDNPLEGVTRITLERPPVNALSRAMVAELTAAAAEVGDETSLRAVLIAARGKAFCAGADLKERRGMSDEEVIATVRGIGEMTSAIAAIPVPTIAVIHGAALGGGLELALACDIRIAAASARVGLPECSLAIIPGAGGTQRLARLAGPARAKLWVLSGRVAAASEAVADGVVDRAVPDDQLDRTVADLTADLARCGPLALRAAKRAIDRGLAAGSLEAGLTEEWAAYETIIPTADRLEALAAFAEKRRPRFEGR